LARLLGVEASPPEVTGSNRPNVRGAFQLGCSSSARAWSIWSYAWAGSIHESGEVGPDGLMHVWFGPDPSLVSDALTLAVMLHVHAVTMWKKASAPPTGDVG
jgi:hypothetical protein